MGMERILALNDEAHHWYREKPIGEDEEGPLKGDDPEGGRAEPRVGAGLDLRARSGAAEARPAARDRSLGHALLPARLGLCRGDAVPLDGERLLAYGCRACRSPTTSPAARCRSSGTSGNIDEHGNLLIDSEQLDSGEALDKHFRVAAGDEIEGFRREIVARTGDGRQAGHLSDQDLLREVMNTVGKPDALGGSMRCVFCVSMLTEGWDARTVTHVLGAAPSARRSCPSRSSAARSAASRKIRTWMASSTYIRWMRTMARWRCSSKRWSSWRFRDQDYRRAARFEAAARQAGTSRRKQGRRLSTVDTPSGWSEQGGLLRQLRVQRRAMGASCRCAARAWDEWRRHLHRRVRLWYTVQCGRRN